MVRQWMMILFAVALVTGVAMTAAVAAAGADTVPRMTVDELKAMLGNPELLIIDVRTGRSWDDEKLKIKDAVRRDPTTDTWMDQVPRDKTIVLYCT